MRPLSEEGRRTLGEIAGRYGMSFEAVEHMLFAVIAGYGTQAQFNHPEFGGMGQWSQGGMIMIGDMFNNQLKARVDSLCNELSALIRSTEVLAPLPSFQSQSQNQSSGVSLFVPGAFSSRNWWPDELGQPSSTGAQNNLRYAFFPSTRRLAIDLGGTITIYDTGDHQIGGFSQQQSGDQSLSFTSQYGLVRVSDLPMVPTGGFRQENVAVAERAPVHVAAAEPQTPIVPAFSTPEPVPAAPVQTSTVSTETEDDIFAKIEKLANLHAKGILTDEEYKTKKADLLNRL
jgi:hypothetical protein